jgi:hypothetical protein
VASTRLASVFQATLQRPLEIGFNVGEGSIEHFPARHNHYVQSWLRLENRPGFVAPEQLPREALYSIATDSGS